MKNTYPVWDIVENNREAFIELSDRVFDTPETLYGEFSSVAAHIDVLEQQGFRLTRNAAGMPTAVIGEAGEEGPVIAILGEFDALPNLSQESGVASHSPVKDGGNGHGCGHNILGAAALLAATAVKDWLAQNNLTARVRYYGCPAEEGGAAKTYMVRDGLFDDVDCAISWHPANFNAVNLPCSLANTRIDFTFTGKSAHAAGAPELGRSALDAVELMNVGVNYMREHMPDDARVHYAYIDAGGIAPNVVQHHAIVRQLIRARDLEGLHDLVKRVRNIAEGAALMTETRVESRVFSAVANLLGNRTLEDVMQSELERLGPVAFDDSDRAFATDIQKTLTDADKANTFQRIGRDYDPEMALCDFVTPLEKLEQVGIGSTDVGDVSWAVPTVQARVVTSAIGTQLHTWQMSAHGKTPIAHKGMVHAAKLMAATACRIIENPSILAQAKAEHRDHLNKSPYLCPLPADAQPPILKRAT